MISIHILFIAQLISILVISRECARSDIDCFKMAIDAEKNCCLRYIDDDGYPVEEKLELMQLIQTTPTASLRSVKGFGRSWIVLFNKHSQSRIVSFNKELENILHMHLIHYKFAIPSLETRTCLDSLPCTGTKASQIVLGRYPPRGTQILGSVKHCFGRYRDSSMIHRDRLVFRMYRELSAVARKIFEINYFQRNISPQTVLVTRFDGKFHFQNSMLNSLVNYQHDRGSWCTNPVDRIGVLGVSYPVIVDMFGVVRTMTWLYDALTGEKEFKLNLNTPTKVTGKCTSERQWNAYARRIEQLSRITGKPLIVDFLVEWHRRITEEPNTLDWRKLDTIVDLAWSSLIDADDEVKCRERFRRFVKNPEIRKFARFVQKMYSSWKRSTYNVEVRRTMFGEAYFGVCYTYIQRTIRMVETMANQQHSVPPAFYIVRIEKRRRGIKSYYTMSMANPVPEIPEPIILMSTRYHDAMLGMDV
eukprot:784410_1